MFLLNPYIFGNGVFEPTDVPDLTAWWDPSDSSTVTLSGSRVTTLASKAGGGIDFIAAGGTSSNLPMIASSGGIDWLEMLASQQRRMQVGSAVDSDINFGTGEFTIFAVFKTVGGPTGVNTLLNKGSNAQGRYKVNINQTSAGTWRGFIHDGSTAFSASAGSGSNDNNPHLIMVQRDNAANLLRTWGDGVELATVSTSTAGDIDESGTGSFNPVLLLGTAPSGAGFASEWFDGLIGEILFYKRAVNSGERGSIETYLTTKWGI